MPDWQWQLEQFEEEQRPDDQRLPSSTTRPFLHPRRRVTSIFPVALLFTASLVSPFVCIRLSPHENNTRATLSTSPCNPAPLAPTPRPSTVRHLRAMFNFRQADRL
jgi:hypothetical protein